jgi:Domain of unknown function (DUF4397)
MTPTPARRRRRVALGLAAAALTLAVGATSAGAAPTPAGPSEIRVAHFSPDTPPMDVYATGFDGQETLVLPKLGFGQVSQYMSLPGGSYAFSMRPAGAPASSPAVLRVSAELSDGTAYTFAAFGHTRSLETDLLTDDLSAPPAGQARVRLIQASGDSGAVDVSAGNAPLLAERAALGSVGSYSAVPAGSIEVTASAAGVAPVVQRLDLGPGTVNSVVVLDKPDAGGLQVVALTDATGTAGAAGARGMPAGGVDTGGGATAAERTGGTPAAVVAGAAVVAALAAGSLGLLVSATGRGRRRVA